MSIVRILVSLALIFALLALAACAQDIAPGRTLEQSASILTIETDAGEHRFNVEFADTDEERSLGLMHRTELAPDAGMLFDFGEPKPVSMWMKNTLIPLDMAFIDQDGVIKRIVAETTPRSLESIPSGEPVSAVLEVAGGVFADLGIEPGDQVRHPLFKNK